MKVLSFFLACALALGASAQSNYPFNGLDMNMGNLSRLSNAKSRSLSPENYNGEKGGGAKADPRDGTPELNVSIRSVADSQKSLFLGVKADDKFSVNVNEAFVNEEDRAQLLKVKKEDLAGLEPEWEVTVVNVKTFAPAEENQETYDKIFGKGVVTTPEELDVRITERLQNNHKQDSDYKLNQDIREYYVNKAGISLPEAFLKRWLLENNKEKVTKEDVDKEFDSFAKDFIWDSS